ncbi:MAG: ABC transporter permease [Acidimicrobiales bacterium]
MNSTVAYITARAMLGRKRALLLVAVPLVLLCLALVVRLVGVGTAEHTAGVLGILALGAIVPLLGLIIGTGVVAPEIDDGSIIYLLAKPVSRLVIVVTKLVVAIACLVIFAAVPTMLAGVIMSGNDDGLALGYAIGALVGGIAYCALFLLLAVVTRHAVVVGLLYALLWESLIGGYVPGARTLSVQQWAVSVTSSLAEDGAVTADVGLAVAAAFLAVATAGGTWLASQRLRSLSLTGEE